MPDKKQLLHWF